MGEPKLLMPWREDRIIDRVLAAWTQSKVDQVVIVVRSGDTELQQACRRWPVDVLVPSSDPADMKASILAGMSWIESTHQPIAGDLCFIAPADLPTLSRRLIDQMIPPKKTCSAIRLPFFGTKQGHPVLLPWAVASQIRDLAQDEGLDSLIAGQTCEALKFPPEERIRDVDTPGEYQRLWRESGRGSD